LWFIFGILGLAVLCLLPQVMQRVDANHSRDYEERLSLIRMAWNVIRAHPILGVGAGAYSFEFRQYQPHDLLGDGVWVYIVHNVYLLRWAETGVFGLCSLLLFFVVGLRKAVVCTRVHDENQAALALGCSAAVVALLWEMLWDVSLGFSANALVWFLFGLLVAVQRVEFEMAPWQVPR
jgi:O-antigen ligase